MLTSTSWRTIMGKAMQLIMALMGPSRSRKGPMSMRQHETIS